MLRSLGALIVLGLGLALWPQAAPAAAATLYVTNTKSDSISIIDTTTFEVMGTIPLGKRKPNRIVFHPDGKTAWVVYDKSRDLGVVDAEAQRLSKRVKIGGNPYNLAFSPDGRYLYVLDWSYDLKAERVDGQIGVSTWPAHSLFTRDGKTFFVSGETAGDLSVIDTASQKIVARLWTGADAMGLALTADEKILYAAGGEEKKVFKVDPATRQAIRIIPVLVVMEPTGRYAFVTNRYADLVTVIDVKTYRQVKSIPVGKSPHGMSLRPH